MRIEPERIRRLHYGYIVAPEGTANAGQPIPVVGYYTYPEFTFDFADAWLEVIRGEAEMVPGVRLIPTPGHTPGHQALVVDTRAGRVLLAGQAFNNASEFSFAGLLAPARGRGSRPDRDVPALDAAHRRPQAAARLLRPRPAHL